MQRHAVKMLPDEGRYFRPGQIVPFDIHPGHSPFFKVRLSLLSQYHPLFAVVPTPNALVAPEMDPAQPIVDVTNGQPIRFSG